MFFLFAAAMMKNDDLVFECFSRYIAIEEVAHTPV